MDASWTWLLTPYGSFALQSKSFQQGNIQADLSPFLRPCWWTVYSSVASFTNRKHSLYLILFNVCGKLKRKLSRYCNERSKALSRHQDLSCMGWLCTSYPGFACLFPSYISMQSFRGQHASVRKRDILQLEKGTHHYLLQNSLSKTVRPHSSPENLHWF